MLRDGQPGAWLDLKTVDTLSRDHQLVPQLKLQIKSLEDLSSANQRQVDALNVSLKQAQEAAQPHWYESPILWFLAGAASTVAVVLVAH